MKQIFLAVAVFAFYLAGAAPLSAAPSWSPLRQQDARVQAQQLPVIVVGGHRGHWGWRRPLGPLLALPPALAALALRPFVPVPRESYRDAVRSEPIAPDPAQPMPPAAPLTPVRPTGSSAPWVDPDEPSR
jgi:hypothetical protein